MGIKIKNLQTGEFEKFNIPALKGEKGEPGEIEPSEKVDYIGKQHSKLRNTMNANVDYIIKTTIGEFNYLDYEGQQITATNTLEGRSKSAILKGQTLVNLFNKHISDVKYGRNTTSTIEEDGSITISGTWWAGFKIPVKANTQYTLFATSKKNNGKIAICDDAVINGIAAYPNLQENTSIIKTFTTKDDTNLRLVLYVGAYTNIILLEGDYTNIDIPYFEGMQSVKMPVLTTYTNLFTGFVVFGYIDNAGNVVEMSDNIVSDFIEINAKNIAFRSFTKDGEPFRRFGEFAFYDINKKFISRKIYSDQTDECTTVPDGTKYVRIWTIPLGGSGLNTKGMMVYTKDKPSLAITKYSASNKTNILTVNEDVELRGIGDVQDTLNCLTGEVTQRIGEVILNGETTANGHTSVDGYIGDYARHISQLVDGKNEKLYFQGFVGNIGNSKDYILTNGFLQYKGFRPDNSELEEGLYRYSGSDHAYICISASRFTEHTFEGIKKFLSENPQSYLVTNKESVVKTVDLSDNHVYSYKGTTHYSCSSEEGSLVPTLSVKVPTDTQLTIQEQKATTQTLLIKNMDLQQSIKEVQAMNLAFNTALYNSFNSIREEVEDIKKHVSTNENLEGSF